MVNYDSKNIFELREIQLKDNLDRLLKRIGKVDTKKRQQAIIKIKSRLDEVRYLKKAKK